MRRRFISPVLWVPTLLLVGSLSWGQEERELLNDQSEGLIELTGQSRLRVIGIRGSISLRAAREGELRYVARSRDNRREERGIALWYEGRTLQLSPLEGAEEQPLIVEVAVSPEMKVEIETTDAVLQLSGLASEVTVRGSAIHVDARGLRGSLEVDVRGGKFVGDGIDDGVSLSGSELEARIANVSPFVSLDLAGSTVELEEITGRLDGELEQTRLKSRLVRGPIRLSASGGSIELANLLREVELRLDETSVRAGPSEGEVRGAIDVETNDDVVLLDLKGNVRIHSYGGNIRGSGLSGQLDLATYSAEIQIEGMVGTTTLKGDDLRAGLKAVGDLRVEATSSTILVEEAEGAIDIANDFGDVTVIKAKQSVAVASRDGDVSVRQLNGPLDLKAAGNRVEVSWAQMASEGESRIENEAGEVWLELPAKAACSFSAQSDSGQIEADMPGIEVGPDGDTAKGTLGRPSKTKLTVRSSGNIYLGRTGTLLAGN